MHFVKKYDFSSTSMFKGSTDVTLTRLQELDLGMDPSVNLKFEKINILGFNWTQV